MTNSRLGLARSGEGRSNPGLYASFIPRNLVSACIFSLVSLVALFFCGISLSATLPVVAAVFASVMTAFVLWREIRKSGNAALHCPQGQEHDVADREPLANIPGLISCHDAQGNLLSVSGADYKTFGFDQAHLHPGDFFERVHVGGRIAFLSAIDDLRRGEQRAFAECLLARGRNEQEYRPVRIEFSRQSDCEGGFAGFTAHTADAMLTSELRAEAARWKAEAESANDIKTRFLAAVSHELRTPLNAILGFSDILRGEYFGKFENERQKEYVELIHRSGHHLLAVVNTMLDMSKIAAGRYELVKEPFRLADAIHTIEEMLDHQAKAKNVVLTTRVSRALDDVVADRRALQQVLINLAGNAIKFTPAGGVVSVDAARDGSNFVLSVSDTGIGIPADKLPLIGTPFMQAQGDYTRRFEGTGLGLALVKGLVSLHGGTFTIESEVGSGTTVTIIIPIDGDCESGGERIEFPPRLRNHVLEQQTGENRHGTVQAKIA